MCAIGSKATGLQNIVHICPSHLRQCVSLHFEPCPKQSLIKIFAKSLRSMLGKNCKLFAMIACVQRFSGSWKCKTTSLNLPRLASYTEWFLCVVQTIHSVTIRIRMNENSAEALQWLVIFSVGIYCGDICRSYQVLRRYSHTRLHTIWQTTIHIGHWLPHPLIVAVRATGQSVAVYRANEYTIYFGAKYRQAL